MQNVPVIERVLSGVPVAAVLLDVATRKVVGLRVYSAAAIRAMAKETT